MYRNFWSLVKGELSNVPQRGQTLIEVVTALSAITIVATAISVIVISGLNNVESGKNQDIATKYAQEGLEITHSVRNRDYLQFKNYNGTYCLPQDATDLTQNGPCTTPNVDNYVRYVQIEQSPGCGTNIAKVTLSVVWSDNRCQSASNFCHSIKLISCLSTVNPIPAP